MKIPSLGRFTTREQLLLTAGVLVLEMCQARRARKRTERIERMQWLQEQMDRYEVSMARANGTYFPVPWGGRTPPEFPQPGDHWKHPDVPYWQVWSTRGGWQPVSPPHPSPKGTP